jgi:hypothetical protein
MYKQKEHKYKKKKTRSKGTADVRGEEERESTNYRLSTFKCKTTLQTAVHRF